MKNDKLLEYVEYFNTLYWAGDILMSISDYKGLQKHSRFAKCTDEQKEDITSKIYENWKALSNYDPMLLSDEIWKNLFNNSIDKKAYIIYVLRRFGEISAYLNLGNEVRFDFRALTCSNIIRKIDSYTFEEHTEQMINRTLYNHEMERYVSFCRDKLRRFLTSFDCKCHDFGYDIIEIQREAGFCIYKQDTKEMEIFARHGISYNATLSQTDHPNDTPEKYSIYDAKHTEKVSALLLSIFKGDVTMLNKFLSRIKGKSGVKVAIEVQALMKLNKVRKEDVNRPLWTEISKIQNIGTESNWNTVLNSKHISQVEAIISEYQ